MDLPLEEEVATTTECTTHNTTALAKRVMFRPKEEPDQPQTFFELLLLIFNVTNLWALYARSLLSLSLRNE